MASAPNFDEVKEMAGSLQETLGVSNEQVLATSVAWDTLRNATIIGDRELELIRHYDVKSPITQDQLLQQYGNEYAGLFLTLVRQINTDDSLQYVLALIDNLLAADQTRAQLFLRQPAPFEPFASILNRATASRFCTSRASKILGLLLVKSPLPGPDDIVRLLLHWCSEQLRSKVAADVSVGLSALQVLLRKNEYRTAFFNDDGLNKLTNLLRSQTSGPANSQLLYQAIYSMWLLSYNKSLAEQFHTTSSITRIIDTIRQVTKVKVIRVGIATLTNLLDKGPNNLQMIEAGCVRVLDNLSQRKKWGDTDLEENIETLSEALRDNIAEMSSFDMYKAEITSGNLDWTPVHRSEKFWRENIARFGDNDNEVLGVLVHLLRTSQTPLVLSVACHDVGEFIRFHPRGRQIITALGAKVSVMKLMTHPDEDVKKQALLCIQKLMVVNWEYLAK